MKHSKSLLSICLIVVLAMTTVACGANKAGRLDEAAIKRGRTEGQGTCYISEDTVALSASGASYVEAANACAAVSNMINQARAAQGLPALVWDVALENAARVRAAEITQVFAHERPDGSPFWTVDSRTQYGENLAANYQSADAVFQGWMNSPSHAANILDSDYRTIGIAICQTSDGSWYWAQEFGY